MTSATNLDSQRLSFTLTQDEYLSKYMSRSNHFILLLEDDIDIRENLVLFLESEGFQVIAKSNGKEGLDFLSTHPSLPALILLDLMMPVVSGYEFLIKIEENSHSHLKAIPTVLLSASNDIQKVAQTHKLPFIRKPIQLDQLLQVLEPLR